MSSPRVSVVMTTYNGERFLSAALESILNQSFTDLELIVVDDGSTDNSASIVRSFCARDLRVRGIFLKRNLGIPKAANCGLRAARGEYVARMDSDDLCHRDRLLKQVSYLDKHKNIHAVGCDYRAINKEGFVCSDSYTRRFREPIVIAFGKYRVAQAVLYCSYPVLHPTIVCRRSTFLSIGGYREFFPMTEDEDLYCRFISLHGAIFDNLPMKLYYYRHYESSTTQGFSYFFRIFMIHLILISLEFRRRGFWDPLDKLPLKNYNSLRFRSIPNLLFLQDSLVYLPVCPRERFYCLQRVVVILRRFELKDLSNFSFWEEFCITSGKQIYFNIFFCFLCFRAKKFRATFLYLRYILSLCWNVVFFKIFNVPNRSSDIRLRFFRSLIGTRHWYYGLKYLFFSFIGTPYHTIKFFVVRSFFHLARFAFFIFNKLKN